MQGDALDRYPLQHPLQHDGNLSGVRDPYRVADGYLEHTEREQARRDVRDLLGPDLAFVRAAEGDGQVPAHPQPGGDRVVAHLLVARERVRDALIDVLATEGLRRRSEHRDFRHAGAHRPGEPLEIGHERGIARAGNARGPMGGPTSDSGTPCRE
jgi:hypothetical protein